MKKKRLEWVLGLVLLLGVWLLSREAALYTNARDAKKPVIVVDAGHGGIDPGMVGVNDLKEKDINLSIAKKLRDALEAQGFSAVLTREEDQGLYDESSRNKKAQDMQRRVALIEEKEPLLTISIHQNSYQDASASGPQVFYYGDSKEGEELATILQEALNTGLSVPRPRVAKGNKTYYLLKRSSGVLNIVECGFLTNPEEAALLQTEEYQEKIARAITKGIAAYLSQKGTDA